MNEPSSHTAGALVVLDDDPGRVVRPVHRPLAGFIAQLVACTEGAPAFRARRRAEPGAAVARYVGSAAAQGPRLCRIC